MRIQPGTTIVVVIIIQRECKQVDWSRKHTQEINVEPPFCRLLIWIRLTWMKFSWFCLILGKASSFNGVSRRLAGCKYKLGYIDLSKVIQRHLLSVQGTISTSDIQKCLKKIKKRKPQTKGKGHPSKFDCKTINHHHLFGTKVQCLISWYPDSFFLFVFLISH